MTEIGRHAAMRPSRTPLRHRRLGSAVAVVATCGVVAGVVGAGLTMAAPQPGAQSGAVQPLAAGSALPAQAPVPPTAPAVPTPPTPCAPVTLVTADDAPAPPGGGPAAPGLLREVTSGLAPLGPRLEIVDVARPAGAPNVATGWAGAVRTAMESTVARCPTTTLVVYAYSEGAVAAAGALATLERLSSPALGRLEGTALVGNPARDPAHRTIPAAVPGQGLVPSAPGALGRLTQRTVEICAPTDPVCASPPDAGGPAALRPALASPAHDSYRQLPTGIGGRTASVWLTDAARQVVDLTAPAPAPVPRATAPAPDPGNPGADSPGADSPRAEPPVTGRSPVSATLDGLGLPTGRAPGLIWRAARSGAIGFGAFDRNDYDEQSGSPTLVPSPNVPGRKALRFTVAGGEPRSEMQPRTPDPREGQTQYIGYYGVLGRDFPTTAERFQIIMQWHHPGPNGSPPLTVEVSNGEVRLTGGEEKRFIAPVGPVRPGDVLDLVLKVTFSSDPRKGSVSVWKDGRQLVRDFRPPQGTLYRGDDSAYMKMGLYKSTSIGRPGTVYVNDVLVGSTMESVSRVRR